MNTTKLTYLDALGIQTWRLRNPSGGPQLTIVETGAAAEAVSATTTHTAATDRATAVATCATTTRITPATSSPEWIALRAAAMTCTACGLDITHTQTVCGVGNETAELMIIGEALGFHEDQQGEPFAGQAGQLLNAMLLSIGFDRSSVFIANILKCRPSNNPDSLPAEVKLCTPFLEQQIALVKPKILLALGPIAAQYLLETKSSLENLRSQLHQFGNTPLITTYHPDYLLRNPVDKGKAYQDLQLTYQTLKKL